ncbi:hypothetical protein O6R08_02375 [Cutibacterium equinum]|uniref:Lipoprotein n=1 Tax=Cutibacterium equinum TaxID=3016342 RepID=A0ABY7QZC0_9ACTN|nr:hypothetical protein [Cutibacterium equinum]WCC80395.1 hypothetical protein O6R08_02375 [Cutibacterium equinum]
MSLSRSKMTRVVAAGAAGALAVVGLSGCSSQSPSTAIAAGSRTISMKTFDEAVDHCGDLAQGGALSPRQVIASTLAQGAVGEQILSDTGRGLNTAQRDQIIATNGLTVLTKDPVCRDLGRSLAAMYHVVNSDGQDKALEEITAVDVSVNPRLGTWDARNLAVHGSSSLSDPFTSGS